MIFFPPEILYLKKQFKFSGNYLLVQLLKGLMYLFICISFALLDPEIYDQLSICFDCLSYDFYLG